MDYKAFKNLARGINDNEDFPEDLLKTLHKNIALKPIAVHEIDRKQNIRKKHANLTAREKIRLFKKETDE